ncbi:MAG: hypothetical protein EBZ77_04960, partial [Chitinophagia bacterium]|nr:hypothetical protein [Chitinophagia bacterium]
NFQKLFRFPYLKEGDTAEKRDAFRSFLREHNYVINTLHPDFDDNVRLVTLEEYYWDNRLL